MGFVQQAHISLTVCMRQSTHTAQLLVTISFKTHFTQCVELCHNALSHRMQSKVVQHLRLTLVSLLHDSGKVPLSLFPRRVNETNCTSNNPHLDRQPPHNKQLYLRARM